jgi:release factor glutamine methyltransferase
LKLLSLKNTFQNSLSKIYEEQEIDNIFYLVAQNILDKKKSILRMALHEEWAEFEEKKLIFYHYLSDLQQGKPIQHILGETEFYGYTFFVNKTVLIPRPETEELIEWVLADFDKNKDEKQVLDIGTGSGCIAITLKKQKPEWSVSAIDISQKALDLAKENSHRLNAKIDFFLFDVRSDSFLIDKKFDLIVSNPPYISIKEKLDMNKNVVDFEPHLALFVEDKNPLLFYEKIIALAKNNLSENGSVYVEINQFLAKETKQLFDQNFSQVELKKDISNNYRMIKASL